MNRSYHRNCLVIFILLFATAGVAKAQVPDYAPNKEWYYGYASHEIWASQYFYQHLVTDGDTVIMGRNCVKVKQVDDTGNDWNSSIFEYQNMGKRTFFLHREPDKLLWFNEESGEFTVLHDYSAQPGEDWSIQVSDCLINIIVDSVDMVFFGGRNHRVLYVHDDFYEGLESHEGPYYYPFYGGCIIEDVGHTGHFLPQEIYWLCHGSFLCGAPEPLGIRCVLEDGEILYNQGNIACDSSYTILHAGVQEGYDFLELKVYPNPSSGKVNIECQEVAEVRIYNSFGLLVKTFQNMNVVNLGTLPKGLYMLIITDTNNVKGTAKVILE